MEPGNTRLKRRVLRDGLRTDEARAEAIRRAVRSIPRGRVSTYGEVAAAAGYPLHHRLVARILGKAGDALPWQRVVGAGGQIKLRAGAALEQRLRLEMEGVSFRGARVDLARHRHGFELWQEG